MDADAVAKAGYDGLMRGQAGGDPRALEPAAGVPPVRPAAALAVIARRLNTTEA